MVIKLNKFGNVLTSRDSGKESYAAFLPSLDVVMDNETVDVDFDGVMSFSPSWGDEFLTPLAQRFGDRLRLLKTDNLAVKMTLETLEETGGQKFMVI